MVERDRRITQVLRHEPVAVLKRTLQRTVMKEVDHGGNATAQEYYAIYITERDRENLHGAEIHLRS